MLRSTLAVSMFALAAWAQVGLHVFDGAAAGDRFGTEVRVVGDVDADGFGDLALDAPNSDVGSHHAGQLTVISRRTRQVTRTCTGKAAQNSEGAAPSTSDCSDSIRVDFKARGQSGIDPQRVAREELFAQYWSRDSADRSTTNLSNGPVHYINP